VTEYIVQVTISEQQCDLKIRTKGPKMSSHNQHDTLEDNSDMEMTRRQIVYTQMHAKGSKWPKIIGVVEIIVGFVLSILGALEIFIVPMTESKDGTNLVIMDKRNCYGAGFFAGVVMVVTGSTAVRASISQRDTTVTRFFNLTMLAMLVYAALTLLLIAAYSKGWTAPDKYTLNSRMTEIHFFVTAFSVLGLLFAVASFFQYIEVICCGAVPLWLPWLVCCCPEIFNKRYRVMYTDSPFRDEFHGMTDPI
jgi:uncharacterized membrane protein